MSYEIMWNNCTFVLVSMYVCTIQTVIMIFVKHSGIITCQFMQPLQPLIILWGVMIEYYGYVTVEDERFIVLRKDLGFTIDLHVEISEIFILRGMGYILST